MEFNYLLHRLQVERIRARGATTREARAAHEELARNYEQRIDELTSDMFSIASGPSARPIARDAER